MLFTTLDYAGFVLLVFALYWGFAALARVGVSANGVRRLQNSLILAGSYVFYGWIHPWFCLLIASSTVVDYLVGLGMERSPERKKALLWVSLVFNLGMLGFFKYFDFFVDSFRVAFEPLGVTLDWITLTVILPVGISFYTFQTLSYTIDIYRGDMRARRNFLDFAVFVSFFPQLVAGPIERARRFLPQIETPRTWSWNRFLSAFPLLVSGVFKKMVVADNLGGIVDRVFMLQDPSLWVLAAGACAFALQVYADFSAYSDIARGSARLIGFELMVNFRTPYLSLTLVDFWRRWHISLSTWIRDYIYIPLGGSRTKTELGFVCTLCAAMGLSGLWHGAAWSFVVWGVYHGLALFAYRKLGLDRQWAPAHPLQAFTAWLATFSVVTFGLAIFRSPSLAWFIDAFADTPRLGMAEDDVRFQQAAIATLVLGAIWAGMILVGRRMAGASSEEVEPAPGPSPLWLWTSRAVGVATVGAAVFSLWRSLQHPTEDYLAGIMIYGLTALYCSVWLVMYLFERFFPRARWLHHTWRWVLIIVLVLYGQEGSRDFVYFAF